MMDIFFESARTRSDCTPWGSMIVETHLELAF